MLKRKLLFSLTLLLSLISLPAAAQSHDEGHGGFNEIFGLVELPFLIIAIVFSFLVAKRLKGGKFGAGMQLLAWGFLIMAVGHLHMQIDHIYDFNLFNTLLGNVAGRAAWFVALIATWGLSSLGFMKIYKASSL
jgi:hypothetical protein